MSAPARRKKKAAPRKRKVLTFTFIVESQKMIVGYRANRMADCGQFEFRSPYKPPRRIPVSLTGYHSYYAPMDEVKAAKCPKTYAREIVLATLASAQAAGRRQAARSLYVEQRPCRLSSAGAFALGKRCARLSRNGRTCDHCRAFGLVTVAVCAHSAR